MMVWEYRMIDVHDKKNENFYNKNMHKLFFDTRKLDLRSRENYGLSEEQMMENAATGLEKAVRSCGIKKIIILCGKGNNGGDGYALARRLFAGEYLVKVCRIFEAESAMCIFEKKLYDLAGGIYCSREDIFIECKKDKCVIVDCVFGSGFHGQMEEKTADFFNKINELNAVKIACDIPSGLDNYGTFRGTVFKADITVTMGADKMCFYSDCAKDICSKIYVENLGISRELFEGDESYSDKINIYLLEENDLILPYRKMQNVNKGSFGHAAVVCGEKKGAAVLAASSALRFGAGLVTLVGKENNFNAGDRIVFDSWGQSGVQKEGFIPYELMCSNDFPLKTNALACGMGLGRKKEDSDFIFNYLESHEEVECVFDADLFYSENLFNYLKKYSGKRKIVLTPHPKEALELIKNTLPELYKEYSLDTQGIKKLVDERVNIIDAFCTKFKGTVLLLKGAVSLIGIHKIGEEKTNIFVNNMGSASLAKAGSGDVLSGMIASLLAQGYDVLEAVKSASLAHAKASVFGKNNFSLTPFELIENLGELN